MNTIHSEAFNHALKVFAFVVGSGVIPALASLYSQNYYWMLLTPIINAIASYLTRYSQLKAAQRA